MFSSSSPLTSKWMIAVTTTRYDDGHISAWFVENHGNGSWWPTRARLDPSLLYNDPDNLGMLAMGLSRRWPMRLGSKSIRLDEIQSLCLRSPLPEPELGEDQSTWCLDILIKLEQRGALDAGQALQIESWLDETTQNTTETQRQSNNTMHGRPMSPSYADYGSPPLGNGRVFPTMPRWPRQMHAVSSSLMV